MADTKANSTAPTAQTERDAISRFVWLLVTVLLGVIVTLMAGWAAEQERVHKVATERIERMEERQTKLEGRLESIDGKLDILIRYQSLQPSQRGARK